LKIKYNHYLTTIIMGNKQTKKIGTSNSKAKEEVKKVEKASKKAVTKVENTMMKKIIKVTLVGDNPKRIISFGRSTKVGGKASLIGDVIIKKETRTITVLHTIGMDELKFCVSDKFVTIRTTTEPDLVIDDLGGITVKGLSKMDDNGCYYDDEKPAVQSLPVITLDDGKVVNDLPPRTTKFTIQIRNDYPHAPAKVSIQQSYGRGDDSIHMIPSGVTETWYRYFLFRGDGGDQDSETLRMNINGIDTPMTMKSHKGTGMFAVLAITGPGNETTFYDGTMPDEVWIALMSGNGRNV